MTIHRKIVNLRLHCKPLEGKTCNENRVFPAKNLFSLLMVFLSKENSTQKNSPSMFIDFSGFFPPSTWVHSSFIVQFFPQKSHLHIYWFCDFCPPSTFTPTSSTINLWNRPSVQLLLVLYWPFQIAYEGDFRSLCTVSFWQKVTFLISNTN